MGGGTEYWEGMLNMDWSVTFLLHSPVVAMGSMSSPTYLPPPTFSNESNDSTKHLHNTETLTRILPPPIGTQCLSILDLWNFKAEKDPTHLRKCLYLEAQRGKMSLLRI